MNWKQRYAIDKKYQPYGWGLTTLDCPNCGPERYFEHIGDENNWAHYECQGCGHIVQEPSEE